MEQALIEARALQIFIEQIGRRPDLNEMQKFLHIIKTEGWWQGRCLKTLMRGW
jgi:hypothetical protein